MTCRTTDTSFVDNPPTSSKATPNLPLQLQRHEQQVPVEEEQLQQVEEAQPVVDFEVQEAVG